MGGFGEKEQDLVKLGKASREGNGSGLLDERVGRKKSFGGELLGEQGRKGVFDKSGEGWWNGPEDSSGGSRRWEVEGREGKRKGDDGREVSGGDEELGRESRVKGDAGSRPVAEGRRETEIVSMNSWIQSLVGRKETDLETNSGEDSRILSTSSPGPSSSPTKPIPPITLSTSRTTLL
jgi:hypothetical protein